MIAFSCPSCDTELEVSDSRAGAPVKCPDCGHRFTVPARGKRSPAPRESEPERRPRQATGQGSRKQERSERGERHEPSRQNTGLIIACISGAGVLAVAAIIGVILLLRPAKTEIQADRPQIAPVQQQVATLPRIEPPPVKPADEKKTEISSIIPPEMAGGDDSGQVIYRHLLKSAAWILCKMPEGISGGTGTLIDRRNRLVITNHHVVGDSDDILVFFPTYRDGKLVANYARARELAEKSRDYLTAQAAKKKLQPVR